MPNACDGDDDNQLMERLQTLEAAALSAPARSPLGAMFQLCAIADLVETIDEDGFSQTIARALRRALYSIMSVLENLTATRGETCSAYYLRKDLDPFARDAGTA